MGLWSRLHGRGSVWRVGDGVALDGDWAGFRELRRLGR